MGLYAELLLVYSVLDSGAACGICVLFVILSLLLSYINIGHTACIAVKTVLVVIVIVDTVWNIPSFMHSFMRAVGRRCGICGCAICVPSIAGVCNTTNATTHIYECDE